MNSKSGAQKINKIFQKKIAAIMGFYYQHKVCSAVVWLKLLTMLRVGMSVSWCACMRVGACESKRERYYRVFVFTV